MEREIHNLDPAVSRSCTLQSIKNAFRRRIPIRERCRELKGVYEIRAKVAALPSRRWTSRVARAPEHTSRGISLQVLESQERGSNHHSFSAAPCEKELKGEEKLKETLTVGWIGGKCGRSSGSASC
jgi:hypothetical protein